MRKVAKVDFNNTVIIMTSNIGAHLLQKEASLGFVVQSQGTHEKIWTPAK